MEIIIRNGIKMIIVNRIVNFIEFGPCSIYAHKSYFSPPAGEIMMTIGLEFNNGRLMTRGNAESGKRRKAEERTRDEDLRHAIDASGGY